jgi:hypothetical protein
LVNITMPIDRRGTCGISTTLPLRIARKRLLAATAKQSTPQYHTRSTVIPVRFRALRPENLLLQDASPQTGYMLFHPRSCPGKSEPSDSFIGTPLFN